MVDEFDIISDPKLLDAMAGVQRNTIDIDACLARNEIGDADLFAKSYQDKYIYDWGAGAWFVYTGPYWERDQSEKVRYVIGDVIAAVYLAKAADALSSGNKGKHKDFAARANQLMAKKRITSVLDLARTPLALPVTWDQTALVLTVDNGVVDLESGRLLDAEPNDYFKAHANSKYDKKAKSPLWEKTVSDMFDGDLEMVGYVQRLFGYVLSGLANERILPVFYGTGSNGKTVMIETVSAVLGSDYCLSTAADTLMETRYSGGEKPSPFVYSLAGKRLVWANESKEGQRLDMGLIKVLTGGDSISARTLYSGNYITFRPTHTAILVTNHLPHVDASDQAAWDRVLPVEFSMRFVSKPKAHNEKKKITDLKNLLLQEKAGILNWLIQGCIDWQRHGLNTPAKVKDSRKEYRDSEDDFTPFCDECLDTSDRNAETTARMLYSEYCTWCKINSQSPMSSTAFGRRMGGMFIKLKAKRPIKYKGVQLTSTLTGFSL